MRSILASLLLCGWVSALPAAGPVTPKTAEVTVYRSGAKISSVATVKVPAGASEVVFENLSPFFNGNSLQVRIKGDARLNAAVFQLRTPGPAPENPRVQVLRDSLVQLGDDLTRLNNERDVLAEEADLLRKNQLRVASSTNGQVTTLTVNDLRELSAFYRQRTGEIKDRQQQIAILQRGLGERVDQIKNDLTRLQPQAVRQTGEIVMKVNAASAQSLEITCTYLVGNASWSPLYDLRSAGLDQPLQLTYKASVRNSTGFDWKAVLLHLSTAQPLANNNRPVLNPVFIDFRMVAYYRSDDAPAAGAAANVYQMEQVNIKADVAKDALAKIADLDHEGQPLEPETADFVTNFDLPAPQDILADGNENIVTVDEKELPAAYEYHAVPKLDAAVFLLAKLTDYGQYNLLPGTANIFFQDTYVGQTWVNPQTTADTLLLSLGRDEQLTIKRVQPKDFKERRKIFGSKVRESYTFEISIKNNKAQAVTVEVLDQIPVSKQKDITVTLEDRDGAQYTEDFGKLQWTVEVPPGKSKKMRFSYSVEYPKDKAVGLVKG